MPYSGEFSGVTDRIHWWTTRMSTYPLLSTFAQDVLAAPASEAYVERIFSVSGDLSHGKKNRMDANLENRVFLKMNRKLWN